MIGGWGMLAGRAGLHLLVAFVTIAVLRGAKGAPMRDVWDLGWSAAGAVLLGAATILPALAVVCVARRLRWHRVAMGLLLLAGAVMLIQA